MFTLYGFSKVCNCTPRNHSLLAICIKIIQNCKYSTAHAPTHTYTLTNMSICTFMLQKYYNKTTFKSVLGWIFVRLPYGLTLTSSQQVLKLFYTSCCNLLEYEKICWDQLTLISISAESHVYSTMYLIIFWNAFVRIQYNWKVCLNFYMPSVTTNTGGSEVARLDFIGHMEDMHDKWKKAVYVHSQPPQVIIHTAYVVLMWGCQMMIQAYKWTLWVISMALRCVVKWPFYFQ